MAQFFCLVWKKMLLVNFLIERKETVTTRKLISHEVKLEHLRQATRGYYLSLSLAIYWLMADKLKSLQSIWLQTRSDGQLRWKYRQHKLWTHTKFLLSSLWLLEKDCNVVKLQTLILCCCAFSPWSMRESTSFLYME